MNALMKSLAEPFKPAEITWKPGSLTKDGNRCMAMAYADLRAYQDRLDAICGLDWDVVYKPWGDNRIIAELGIAGVVRASTGEMDSTDQKNGMGGTVAEAQAFKRSAAMFGLGRYLYDLPSQWVEFDATKKRISDSGQAQLYQWYKEWYDSQILVWDAVTSFFGNEAEEKMPALVVWASGGKASSPHQLTADQCGKIYKWIEKRTAAQSEQKEAA